MNNRNKIEALTFENNNFINMLNEQYLKFLKNISKIIENNIKPVLARYFHPEKEWRDEMILLTCFTFMIFISVLRECFDDSYLGWVYVFLSTPAFFVQILAIYSVFKERE